MFISSVFLPHGGAVAATIRSIVLAKHEEETLEMVKPSEKKIMRVGKKFKTSIWCYVSWINKRLTAGRRCDGDLDISWLAAKEKGRSGLLLWAAPWWMSGLTCMKTYTLTCTCKESINEPLKAQTNVALFHKDAFCHFSFDHMMLTCSSVFCVGLILLFDAVKDRTSQMSKWRTLRDLCNSYENYSMKVLRCFALSCCLDSLLLRLDPRMTSPAQAAFISGICGAIPSSELRGRRCTAQLKQTAVSTDKWAWTQENIQ